MAEQGSRTLDREILSELRNATTRMAQGLTDLTSLQQTQTTANQDFQSSLDAINNTLQNPVGLQEISDALQVQSRPVLDSYNGRAPHKWANDQLAKIEIANREWHTILTDPDATFADANALPHPAILWADEDEDLYKTNKLLYNYAYVALPLPVQNRCQQDAVARCEARGDQLMRYSAYFLWKIVTRQDENLPAQHLARIKTMRCTDMRAFAGFLVQLRMACSDYRADF